MKKSIYIMGLVVMSIIWISTSAAVSIGIYITGNPWCLVAMLIPCMMRIDVDQSERDEE